MHPLRVLLVAAAGTVLPLAGIRPLAAQLAPAKVAAIDSFFAGYVTPGSPGCVVGLIRGDSLVHWRAYGRADVEAAVPFARESAFHPGSIYKQFYAAAILLLAREGRLSLRDDIRKYLPEIPAYGAPVTIYQLLTHTHGLREYTDLLELTPPGTVNDEATILRVLSRQRAPAARPGARFWYGNTGPDLAAIIIRRVSGVSASEFTRAHVLEPAGMRATAFGRDAMGNLPPRVPGYDRRPNGTLDRRDPAPGSRTTVDDLARWNRQWEAPDPALLTVLGQLAEPVVLSNGTVLRDLGMGVRLSPYRGLRRVWAPGGARGYRAMFMRFPGPGLTIALGCNRSDVNPVQAAEAIADIALADHIARVERRPPAGRVALGARELRALVGTYVSPTGNVVRVVLKDGRLFTVADTAEYEMIPAGGGRFTYAGQPVIARDPALEARFVPGRRGAPATLELRTNWDPILFTAVKPVERGAIAAEEYVGTYGSDEVESTLEVLRGAGGLVLKAPRGDYALEPVARDLFRAGPQLVRFTRRNGRVTAAVVSRGGVPELVFTRRPPAP